MVIDGATDATTTVGRGTQPNAVAVNPVTNKIYLANQSSNNVTVIDGATKVTMTVGAGPSPTHPARLWSSKDFFCFQPDSLLSAQHCVAEALLAE